MIRIGADHLEIYFKMYASQLLICDSLRKHVIE